MDEERKAPICPLCGVRERSFDGEPPLSDNWESNFYSHCYECSSLCGTREHTHTYYGSPAQVAAGTVKDGHSWRTTVTLRPIMEDGKHVGFRCLEFDRCGWEHRFTAEEFLSCSEHVTHGGFPYTTIKGMCFNSQDHRRERGECDERGYITDYGREQERLRSDAANWDPGHYVER